MKDFIEFIPGVPVPSVIREAVILPDSKIHIAQRSIHLMLQSAQPLEEDVVGELEQRIAQKLRLNRMKITIRHKLEEAPKAALENRVRGEINGERDPRETGESVRSGESKGTDGSGENIGAGASTETRNREESVKPPEKDKVSTFVQSRNDEQARMVAQALSNNRAPADKPKAGAVVYGKPFKGDPVPLRDVGRDYGRIVVEGDIFKLEKRETRRGMLVYIISITDNTYSINCKIICDKNAGASIDNGIKKGARIRVKGDLSEDKFDNEVVVMINDIMLQEKQKKLDLAEKKRVELHCHTKMSAMDGLSSVGDIIQRADEWGHKAIAITDHGVIQAFPDAHLAAKKRDIKVIYGVECYIVNDGVSIVSGETDAGLDGEYVVFDIETTGLSAVQNQIIEIGAVRVAGGRVTEVFSEFVNPGVRIPANITELTGINDEMVADASEIDVILPKFLEFAKDAVLVAHNADFDMSFIRRACEKQCRKISNAVLDTLSLSRAMFPQLQRHKLNIIAKHLGVSLVNHHRACDDARATGEILIKCFAMLKEMGLTHAQEINSRLSGAADIKKLKSYHAIILTKNSVGLKNLYKIISESHLNYFYRTPRVPKSLYLKYKEGLLLGSACEAGELYSAILGGKPEDEVEAIARFYDYLEIQPLGNNAFMLRNGTVPNEDALIDINKKIIALGEKLNKLVVATCDVHFLNPEDEIYRRVLMTAQGFDDADKQAPLFLRTTDEMLGEFTYLNKEKAYEVVVENPNKIADMIEEIKPIPDETYPPEMEGAEEELTTMCYEKAKRIYGDPLPEVVAKRMERELEPIVKNGFAVMYMIAQRLVAKSLSDGYLVGSRGSVGSSLIAFMAGITEVNSLMPHYICDKCQYSEFIDDGSYSSGYDLPDKVCPNCGEKLSKNGHDIPFETFLGFNADKEPDIDLNFSGDYQSVAHKYTEELFGEGHVFRAGTIGTVADKTAYGYVQKYIEKTGQYLNKAEIDRLVAGCAGVKRTTGQHPGGVMIVPRNNEVYFFTPIQHPADDRDSDIITTHFDYHSISGRLLKLDILGHDDPTAIRMLEDLTGLDATTIPLDDPETMSLFVGTSALSVTPEQINSKVGTFGVPEFGTKFVRQMLEDTKPTTFSELVRISGLSHGTDVWLGNAQDLIVNDGLTLSEVICARDDIMGALIRRGLPNLDSFKIMESVRKGKGLSPEQEALMRENHVEEWYINSCKKIKYLFPRAHAVAYVMMAFRIAYFKVHYPIEFYMTYFTVRADDFDAELMCKGVDVAKRTLAEYESKGNAASQKEKNVATILEMCVEMYCRGFSFLPIDLKRSDAVRFQCVDGKILPPLNALNGLGTNAARNIVEAREEEEFMSIEDMQVRAKLTKTVVEALRAQGCLDGMDESSQMTLF